MALIMLNLLLKTRQNDYTAYTHMGNGTENTYAYDASASGCGASWPMKTAAWKRRSNLSLTADFLLVENVLSDFRHATF